MEQGDTFEVGEEDWYQTDLQLAAELGKALLERNRDLEVQFLQLQQANQDQALENEFMSKQLELLRESTESRMRVYEDLDKTSQELEKANQRLLIDAKADKQRIEKLSSTVNSLEDKCEELQKKIDELKVEGCRQRKQQKHESRRAQSLANLREKEKKDYIENIYNGEIHWTYTDNLKNLPLNPFEIEIKTLQETTKQLKTQQLIDKRKKEDLEAEVGLLWEENESLDKKMKKEVAERLRVVSSMEEEIQRVKLEAGSFCKLCADSFERRDKTQEVLEKDVEHDDPTLNTGGKLVRLGGGGSVYGSRESVNKIAPDSKELSPDEPDNILNELESQYQSLFEKYESLMQGKGKRGASFHEATGETFDEALHRHLAVSHKEVQTLLQMHKTRDAATGVKSPDDEHPPPYKSLFRDLFATLKKTRIEESGEMPPVSSNSTPATSPVGCSAPATSNASCSKMATSRGACSKSTSTQS